LRDLGKQLTVIPAQHERLLGRLVLQQESRPLHPGMGSFDLGPEGSSGVKTILHHLVQALQERVIPPLSWIDAVTDASERATACNRRRSLKPGAESGGRLSSVRTLRIA